MGYVKETLVAIGSQGSVVLYFYWLSITTFCTAAETGSNIVPFKIASPWPLTY